MSKLLYIINTSLDGYIKDEAGDFDWANPEGIFAFITDLVRPVGTYLYGRRIYETMLYWDAPIEDYEPNHHDFARVWQHAEKIVFSRALTSVSAHNARLERDFDVETIRKLKQASEHDIAIAGAELAGVALEAGLIDECHLFVHPVVVGGGAPALPTAKRRNLELLELRRFETGVVQLHYKVHSGAT